MPPEKEVVVNKEVVVEEEVVVALTGRRVNANKSSTFCAPWRLVYVDATTCLYATTTSSYDDDFFIYDDFFFQVA